MYVEMKLFFIRQSFPHLDVEKMNDLLKLFKIILDPKLDPKKHPLVNTYNPVKCSLLIYEICWKIERKNIYSLQRTCDSIMEYLLKSLSKYFMD